jgi:hypothetical protein
MFLEYGKTVADLDLSLFHLVAGFPFPKKTGTLGGDARDPPRG